MIDYLGKASQNIWDSLSERPSRKSVARGLRVACGALQQLSDDESFKRALIELGDRRHANQTAFESILRDVDHFVNGFLNAERQLLQNAGFPNSAIADIVERAKTLRSTLITVDTTPAIVLADLELLREKVCAAAKKWEGDKSMGLLRRSFLGVSGAAIIVLNLGADSLSGAGSAVSAALGTGLISEAVSGLAK